MDKETKKRLVEVLELLQEDEWRIWNRRDGEFKMSNKWYFYNGKLHKVNEVIRIIESKFPFLANKEDGEAVKK